MLVEDSEEDIKLCRACIEDFQQEKSCTIDLVESRNVDEAFIKLDNSFDAAIIDLKLADQGNEGNQVVNRIAESHLRIPMAILTGTPDAADLDFAYIGIFKKGDPGAGYVDIMEHFWKIHNTGLTRIMGGRGKIEETLDNVFKKNLLPEQYRKKWIEYGEKYPDRTEKALLRHALSHLLQLLDYDGSRYFPEEVYLAPPLDSEIRTGSIVKEKSSNIFFVVMNPVCDLVVRDTGECNTDRILLVEIDSQSLLFPKHPPTGLSNSQRKDLEKAYKNNKSYYYHWLPETDFFDGGFLNFRKIFTLSKDELTERFECPSLQVSPSFVKDMIARFSVYYARQGQPDIDFDHFINSSAVQTGNSK
jgi:hypothetical protein